MRMTLRKIRGRVEEGFKDSFDSIFDAGSMPFFGSSQMSVLKLVVTKPPGTTLPTIPHPRKFPYISGLLWGSKSGYYDHFKPVQKENVILGNHLC